MEKKDTSFSKFIVEIRKSRKIKSRFLMFVRLNAEKKSADYYQALNKKEQKRVLMFTKLSAKKGSFDDFHTT